MYSIFSKKQRIRLGKVLLNHCLLATFQMNNNFRLIVTLPPASEVLVAQSGQKICSYKLSNIQLEYESTENRNIANEVSSLYGTGRSLLYDHMTLMKTTTWAANETLVNENINIPRKSIKAIDLLFTKRVGQIVRNLLTQR